MGAEQGPAAVGRRGVDAAGRLSHEVRAALGRAADRDARGAAWSQAAGDGELATLLVGRRGAPASRDRAWRAHDSGEPLDLRDGVDAVVRLRAALPGTARPEPGHVRRLRVHARALERGCPAGPSSLL